MAAMPMPLINPAATGQPASRVKRLPRVSSSTEDHFRRLAAPRTENPAAAKRNSQNTDAARDGSLDRSEPTTLTSRSSEPEANRLRTEACTIRVFWLAVPPQ